MAAEGQWNMAVTLDIKDTPPIRLCWGTLDLGKPETYPILTLLSGIKTEIEAAMNEQLGKVAQDKRVVFGVGFRTF